MSTSAGLVEPEHTVSFITLMHSAKQEAVVHIADHQAKASPFLPLVTVDQGFQVAFSGSYEPTCQCRTPRAWFHPGGEDALRREW